MKNKLNIIKHLSGYCSITLLVVALGFQCNFASASENHDSKNAKESTNEEKGSRSQLTVRHLKPEERQGHIKMKAKITITENSEGDIAEIKFKNKGRSGEVYAFDVNSTEGQGMQIGNLTIISVIALEKCEKESESHILRATLVKSPKRYIAIDYDYWDSENCSSFDPSLVEDLSHGRGGGGGWNN